MHRDSDYVCCNKIDCISFLMHYKLPLIEWFKTMRTSVGRESGCGLTRCSIRVSKAEVKVLAGVECAFGGSTGKGSASGLLTEFIFLWLKES